MRVARYETFMSSPPPARTFNCPAPSLWLLTSASAAGDLIHFSCVCGAQAYLLRSRARASKPPPARPFWASLELSEDLTGPRFLFATVADWVFLLTPRLFRLFIKLSASQSLCDLGASVPRKCQTCSMHVCMHACMHACAHDMFV